MKRKLSLLLAMVLAMTMVMGIGVTAFAEIDPPVSRVDPCHCENTDVSNALVYIISVGTDYCHAYAYSAEDGYIICTSQGTSPLPPENDPKMVESAVKILEEII